MIRLHERIASILAEAGNAFFLKKFLRVYSGLVVIFGIPFGYWKQKQMAQIHQIMLGKIKKGFNLKG
ncbi:MAG: hypothetical protein JZU65_12745 [Chlorobium sp.]|nr:hypothetical protein [Chlorobium sp.]